MNVLLLNLSYCLNNCLPVKDRQPNTIIVLLQEPVTVTIIGLLSKEIHFFLLLRNHIQILIHPVIVYSNPTNLDS